MGKILNRIMGLRDRASCRVLIYITDMHRDSFGGNICTVTWQNLSNAFCGLRGHGIWIDALALTGQLAAGC